MFGRELSEQALADRTDVPVIVTKSISAVEAVGKPTSARCDGRVV